MIGGAIITTCFLPIFRSGGRTGLIFWEWVRNHTIFGPPIEYVPEEDYARELEGVEPLRYQLSTRIGYKPEWNREDSVYYPKD